MKSDKYSRLARILHWISAAVIIWATVTGFFMAALQPESALRAFLSSLNVSLTTLFLPVFFLRMANAALSKGPAELPVPKSQRRAASLMHVSLYATTTIVLLSGVLMMNHDIAVFGLVRLPNPLTDQYWNGLFYGLHRWSCATLALLVIAHVCAVIHHHRRGRRIMSRMALRLPDKAPDGVAMTNTTC